ncbi:MAG: SDR family NAD(P)-dependent oxidoreductase [Maritimibacter sp.]
MTPDEMFSLKGKRALVTGGASGIGLAVARTFAQAGGEVIVADCARDTPEVATRVGARGHIADLGDRGAILSLTEAVGPIDILVSNAGMEGPVGAWENLPETQYLKTFDLNLHAASWLSQALCPGMAKRGGGSVILMASLAAMRGNKMIQTYAMTKAALAQLARNIAVDRGPDNIRANAISPGLIETPFSRNLKSNPAFMARRLAATPLRRMGQPDEIAATALWLASPGGAFVTGQTIVVDGGTLVHDGS